jgi:YHS domain-containing protein
MDRWCQNKRCCLKKNQGQIRGKKGFKYYQSYKATTYYNNLFCSQRCQDQFLNDNWQAVLNAIGEIGKQTIPLDDAWYVDWDYERTRWDNKLERHVTVTPGGHFLINKNRNIRQPITREQAQTPEQLASNNIWRHIDDFQAKELAVQLGLAN